MKRIVPLCIALLLAPVSGSLMAQRRTFTLPQVLGYAFQSDLVASPAGQRFAWSSIQRGVRNVWMAEAPDYRGRMVTSATVEDGQELTNLAFSGDGKYLAWTRGGDHGANWDAEGNLAPDPTSSPVQPKVEIWAAPVDGAPKMIAEGDAPAPSPRGDVVAFEKGHEIWSAPLDGSKPAARLFFARGENASPTWSPDGSTLAFVSDRGTYSFIGLYRSASEPVRYLAPSTSLDSMPRWSPDGRQIAFVRRPGRGGPARPPLELQPAPWAIWVADAATGTAREVWKSGDSLRASYPRVAGGANLRWVAGDRLAFMSYEDGWPHLYSVPGKGGQPLLLTPGNFMVEDVAVTPDLRFLIYSANTGPDPGDGERRHLFKVPVDSARPTALSTGLGIEWAPAVTSDGASVAHLASDAKRPPAVRVLPVSGGEARAIAAETLPQDFPADSLVVPEDVTFKAADGVLVHGQLFKPSEGSGPRPAVVFVHGGPPRQMLLGWHYMFYYANSYAVNQYLASRGFVVLSVNYRLGIGYGFEFHQPERAGARGASEYQDVAAAGRYLQSRPDVDRARIGIWGGSYGGFLTAMALGRNSDIFAAGVDIHGVHHRASLPPPPLELAALIRDGITREQLEEAVRVGWESSPSAHVKTWRSPVLLIHGDDDRNVRSSETVDLAQRLRAQGVPFEEIIIPDDVHDFLLYRNWLRVNAATAEFLEKHLMSGATSAKRLKE